MNHEELGGRNVSDESREAVLHGAAQRSLEEHEDRSLLLLQSVQSLDKSWCARRIRTSRS